MHANQNRTTEHSNGHKPRFAYKKTESKEGQSIDEGKCIFFDDAS